jgi:hypothetical protein
MWLRRASWIVGAAAVVLPGGFWYLQRRHFDAWAAQQQGFVCGVGIFAVMIMAMFLAAVMSLVAAGLGVLAYRRQPDSRTAWRVGEILLLATPLIVFALLAAQSPLTSHLF